MVGQWTNVLLKSWELKTKISCLLQQHSSEEYRKAFEIGSPHYHSARLFRNWQRQESVCWEVPCLKSFQAGDTCCKYEKHSHMNSSRRASMTDQSVSGRYVPRGYHCQRSVSFKWRARGTFPITRPQLTIPRLLVWIAKAPGKSFRNTYSISPHPTPPFISGLLDLSTHPTLPGVTLP